MQGQGSKRPGGQLSRLQREDQQETLLVALRGALLQRYTSLHFEFQVCAVSVHLSLSEVIVIAKLHDAIPIV